MVCPCGATVGAGRRGVKLQTTHSTLLGDPSESGTQTSNMVGRKSHDIYLASSFLFLALNDIKQEKMRITLSVHRTSEKIHI